MKTRKEIIDEYKRTKSQIGVFQIRNKTNNKVFVESSLDLVAIWNRLRFQLNMGSHPNTELQKDWKALGEENFAYEILSEIQQDDTVQMDYRKEAKKLEAMFIEELQPFGERGYHVKKG
jgi:hypothetical protein